MAQQTTRDIISANFAEGKQTFIIPLTIKDVNDLKKNVDRIGYGGDIWELRVDLLSPSSEPLGRENTPPLDYVRQQIMSLQAMSELPILFTIRTFSQGGKFPDNAADEARALMELAIQLGIEYLDVEIEWPPSLIDAISRRKGKTSKVVASYHSWTGKVAWTSQELDEKFRAADAFGGMVHLSASGDLTNICESPLLQTLSSSAFCPRRLKTLTSWACLCGSTRKPTPSPY